MKKNICGLQQLVTAFESIGIISEFVESESFLLSETDKSVTFYLDSKTSFQYEDVSMKPPAVLFSVRFLSTDKKITENTSATHFPIGDNCYRQVLLYKYKKRIQFFHCGYEHYSIDYLLQSIFNINSILQIAGSHIRHSPKFSFVCIQFSCNDVDIQQAYILPAVEKLMKLPGVSPCISSVSFYL